MSAAGKDVSPALVVSDDAEFRAEAHAVLESAGYAVTDATIADAPAIAELSAWEITVVQTDERSEPIRHLADVLHRRNRSALFVGAAPPLAGRLFVHMPHAGGQEDIALGALRAARKVQRARDASASGLLTELVHSLRNSLMVSVGNLVFLRAASLDGEFRDALEDSYEATLTMQRLLWDVSHLQRIIGGTAALQPARLDIGSVLAEVARSLPAREQKLARIEIEVEGDSLEATADRATILRALGAMTLYSARQVAEGGTILVSAERSSKGVLFRTGAPRSEGADRNSWTSRGDDTLSGMNGVELAYCRAAAEVHGGSFWTSGDPSSPAFFLEIAGPATEGG